MLDGHLNLAHGSAPRVKNPGHPTVLKHLSSRAPLFFYLRILLPSKRSILVAGQVFLLAPTSLSLFNFPKIRVVFLSKENIHMVRPVSRSSSLLGYFHNNNRFTSLKRKKKVSFSFIKRRVLTIFEKRKQKLLQNGEIRFMCVSHTYYKRANHALTGEIDVRLTTLL